MQHIHRAPNNFESFGNAYNNNSFFTNSNLNFNVPDYSRVPAIPSLIENLDHETTRIYPNNSNDNSTNSNCFISSCDTSLLRVQGTANDKNTRKRKYNQFLSIASNHQAPFQRPFQYQYQCQCQCQYETEKIIES